MMSFKAYFCVSILMSLVFFTFFPNDSYARGPNLGHRIGAGSGGYFSVLPENSLRALKAVTLGGSHAPGRKESTPLQYDNRFEYLEFDVQETQDGELVVFHDTKLKRLIPNLGKNQETYREIVREIEEENSLDQLMTIDWDKIAIKQLKMSQLRRFHLGQDVQDRVPTLRELLQAILELGFQKPVALEIKEIRSDKAREEFIHLYSQFKRQYLARTNVLFTSNYDLSPDGVSIIAFPSNFKKSFGRKKAHRKFWCQKLEANGFPRVYRTLFHGRNLCKV